MNYVCKVEDLDKLLPGDRHSGLVKEFINLFSNNWRLRYVPRKEYWEEVPKDPDDTDEEWKNKRRGILERKRNAERKNKFKAFFDKYDIDYLHPTVRDAVAFDLVKLDDDSVSNDNVYRYEEHQNYSPMEYERYLLNRNFRINLVNLDPDWSNITYGKGKKSSSEDEIVEVDSEVDETDVAKKKRTVVKEFQGIRISETLLDYFKKVMDKGSASDGIYVPFTNANDFSAEVALIPNTHPDFRQITSRAYYDTKWAQYKRLCQKYGFVNIATFALVDPKKDKNHTGEWLVKIQSGSEGNWKYLVVKMDKDGHILSEPEVRESSVNSILCVCEDDFYGEKMESDEVWTPVVDDIPMVHSTTSSHYSIFRQRIPDYDLKLVRHYLQFKNRLEGMELCLEQVRRDVHHKEVHSAECFSKLTMVLKRLMDEFASNKELMSYVTKFYDLYAEWDKLAIKKIQIQDVRDGKLELLQRLQDEYNVLSNSQLDKKLALGQKIGSLKLELDKSIDESLNAIQDRLAEIVSEMVEVNDTIREIQSQNPNEQHIPQETVDRIRSEVTSDKIDDMKEKMEEWRRSRQDSVEDKSQKDKEDLTPDMGIIDERGVSQQSAKELTSNVLPSTRSAKPYDDRPALETLDTSKLHRLIVQSERWRNYSFNMGYELSQFKKMLTMCGDATIKVKRLLHNFEERMKDTQEQVWDEDYNLRRDFDFKDISVAGLRDVILLHDWWAANASGAKPEDMGMTDEQFMEFRRRCNKVSYNLRKNQYAQLLSVKKDRTQRRIQELEDIIKDRKTLHWDDKYGKEAAPESDGWTLDKVDAKARERIRLLSMAEDIIDESEEDVSDRAVVPTQRQLSRRKLRQSIVDADATYKECVKLEKQYREDSKKLVERTVGYLKSLGLIETEADIERLATMNSASRNPEVSQRWMAEIQEQRESLDSAMELMKGQRKSMQSIIDNVAKMEEKIKELKQKNKRIFDICMKSGKKVKGVDRQVRSRMLMDKLDNEQRIFELKSLVKKAKSQHLEDFSALEKMRKDVDEKQEAYNEKVRCFKSDIGLTQEVVDNLMVGIYNKFQDEILEHSKTRKYK